MDIHRCRFIEYPASAINAIAFSHNSGSAGRNQPLRLAIGRANGNIEIWDPRKGAWIHEKTLYGGKDRSVEGLVWTHDPDEKNENGYTTHGRLRLFSIGYSNAVTEWDLNTGLPLRHSTGNSSEIWCLAAQPRWRRKKQSDRTKDEDSASAEEEFRGQYLVAGCADGTLVLLSTEDGGLTFRKYIARASKKNARALSLAFQSRDVVVVGFADSTIRVYDIRNGNLIRNMSLGGGPQGGPKEKLVWAVECLKDGTIVSGDSSGEVCFWDGKTYGQIQRIKGHEADILCLAASEDGQTVLSGGMDRRTVVYKITGAQNQRKSWVKTSHRRFHQHDVKAMARFENSNMSLVVSGGLDKCPILIPLREFGKEHYRMLSHTPQEAPIANAKRYVVSWWDNEVTIWTVNSRKQETLDSDFADSEPNYHTAVQLALKGEESISAASISPCSSFLAVSTSAGTKVFQLQPKQGSQKGALVVKKLEVPKILQNSGARHVQFSPNSKWLLWITPDNTIYVARLTPSTDHNSASLASPILSATPVLPRLHRELKVQNCLNGAWGSYDRTITRASFSSESRVLAVSDLAGNIDTWILEGNEDLAASPVDLAFRGPLRPFISPDNAESDDEGEETNHTIILYGQHWATNPQAHMLPHLLSQPIVLSFRPSSISNPSLLELNGNPAVHATRNNPHAHSHAIPTNIEDRLFVLTASHEIYEFEVLKGRLSDWSRRNPSGLLPEDFKLQRDRAVGSLWDVGMSSSGARKERLWLYGSSWLCMFDLAQDFPQSHGFEAASGQDEASSTESNNNRRKRKSRTYMELQTKRNTTGAGSRISASELGGGVVGRKMRRVDAKGNVSWLRVRDERPVKTSTDSDEEDDGGDDDVMDSLDEDDGSAGMGSLQRLRRAVEGKVLVDGEEEDVQNGHEASLTGKQNAAFWLTNRYRYILGIVPLSPSPGEPGHEETMGGSKGHSLNESHSNGDVDEAEKGEDDVPEVALVERPFFDLDLPPRFVGMQEWEK